MCNQWLHLWRRNRECWPPNIIDYLIIHLNLLPNICVIKLVINMSTRHWVLIIDNHTNWAILLILWSDWLKFFEISNCHFNQLCVLSLNFVHRHLFFMLSYLFQRIVIISQSCLEQTVCSFRTLRQQQPHSVSNSHSFVGDMFLLNLIINTITVNNKSLSEIKC